MVFCIEQFVQDDDNVYSVSEKHTPLLEVCINLGTSLNATEEEQGAELRF